MSPTKIAHIYNPDNQTPDELIANFVVRHKEFNELYNEIKNSSMRAPEQHFIIQGPRGSGKTTLLLRLYYEVENDPDLKPWLLPIIFSEEQYHINTLCKLWESVAEILEEKEEFSGLYDRFETAQETDDYENICFGLLSKALQEKKQKLVLFLDNFGDLLDRFTEEEHHRLREILLTSSDIRIIGASSVTLETTYDYSKPFFDFFRFIYIGGLDSQETRELLLGLGQNYGQAEIKDIVENQPERVEIMRRLTGGIPRTIILLFEVFVDDKTGNSFKDLEIVLDRVTPLYKHRMEELSRQQQAIIDIMALNWDAMSVREISERIRMESKAISAQLKQLEKNRVVHKIETTNKNYLYQITERFFNIWYLMRQGRRREKNKVLWLVKFMQEWCSREELVERTQKHIDALTKEGYHAGHAYFMTEALVRLVSGDLQQELIDKTREFLSIKEKALLITLSKSDRELFEEVRTFFKKQDYKRCLRLLEEIKDKTAPSILYALGLIYEHLHDSDQAEGYYLKAIDKGDVKALNNLANLYFEQKKYDQAEANYLKAIDKGVVEALFNLANLYFEQKKYDQAEGYYLKAIDKGVVQALNNLAILYGEQEKYEQAEAYYLKAIDKGHVKALNNLAYLYDEQEKYEEAEAYYLKAIDKGDVDALFNLAILYGEQEKYEQAEGYYLRAIDKGHVDALFNLAILYGEQEKYEQAEAYYLRAIDKGHLAAMANLSIMYYEQKRDRKKALEFMEKADKEMKNLRTKFGLINILLWNNKTKTAFRHFEEVMEDRNNLEKNISLISFCLTSFMAKKQYHFVLGFFKEKGSDLKDRLRPVYFALMHFLKDEYPNEIKKMGEEIRETVEEIIKEIERLRVDYA